MFQIIYLIILYTITPLYSQEYKITDTYNTPNYIDTTTPNNSYNYADPTIASDTTLATSNMISTNYSSFLSTDSNTISTNSITTKPTNILFYSPPYKTFNYNRLQTKKMPVLVSSEGMLQNINNSFWSLKFYSHPDLALYNQVNISFKDKVLFIQTKDFADKVIEDSEYKLSPIQMFKPNEGIFAYPDKDGQLNFVYMHLLLEYLLAFKIFSTYEEAEQASKESLTSLGIFTLE